MITFGPKLNLKARLDGGKIGYEPHNFSCLHGDDDASDKKRHKEQVGKVAFTLQF